MHDHGTISISGENMFPIIKKWLYSEKDIFIRELTSNCSDAITKLKTISNNDEEVYRIDIAVDSEAKTLSFEDNGIGMTYDEVKKYINQVAFSGAKDFFEKYKSDDENASPSAQIIGHFGLGFYSAFMVAKKVTIDTLSYAEGSEAVRWTSESGLEFEMGESDRETRGTKVTLELDDDSAEFLDKWKVREVINKYFRFLPTPIYLTSDKDVITSKEVTTDDSVAPTPINDSDPLWLKAPKDCTEEEYREFYHKVFFDGQDPLFWVHLNIDYPFRLKGILYFPKLKHEMESVEGQVKLYCNRVFVADNIKEVIPEYLLLLKGCIDCPDLPLNVSRSFLQNDGTVTKLSSHITRKVSDRLTSMFNTERSVYEGYWDDINPFVKYGCLRDEKFYDRVKPALIFKDIDGNYKTIDEYLESNAKTETEEIPMGEGKTEQKTIKTVYYVSDEKVQAQYISMFRKNDLSAVVLTHMLDNHFISFLEYKLQDVRFKRIDSDLSDLTSEKEAELDVSSLETLLGEIAPDMKIENAALLDGAAPMVVTLSEEGRRYGEMSRMFGANPQLADLMKEEYKLIINKAHPVTASLTKLLADGKYDDAKLISTQLYDLARLAQRPLDAAEMTEFISRSCDILAKIIK